MFKRNIKSNALHPFGPLYHKYSFFGVNNEQLPGIFAANQEAKTYILTAYIALALAKVKESQQEVSFAELFCADGYYAMVASRLGATKSRGYDNNFDEHRYFDKAPEVAKALGITNIQFIEQDMQNLEKLEKADVVANVGGLYHVPNPEEILKKSYKMARRYLIVQTVVSLENNKPDYFITPAPRQDWGSRYSRKSFDNLIKKLNYKVVDKHFNLLQGNHQKSDQGSVYYLIEKR